MLNNRILTKSDIIIFNHHNNIYNNLNVQFIIPHHKYLNKIHKIKITNKKQILNNINPSINISYTISINIKHPIIIISHFLI